MECALLLPPPRCSNFTTSKPLPCRRCLYLHLLGTAQTLSLLLLLCSMLPLPTITAEMLSFEYANFKNSSGIGFVGNVSVTASGSIQLTTESIWSMGRAYYLQPIHLWNVSTDELISFSTSFTFAISNASGNLGGGVAFSLLEDPNMPLAIRGDYLGLVSDLSTRRSTTGSRFVAVEFDSWENPWETLRTEPYPNNYSHLGIDINSIDSVVRLRMGRNTFHPGRKGNAQISYSSNTKNLSVSFDYNHTLYALSYVVDLRDVLPPSVYVGFSLTTDESNDAKFISSWRFESSRSDAPGNISTPSSKKNTSVILAAITALLLLIVFGGVVFLAIWKHRRRKARKMFAAGHRYGSANEEGPRSIPFKYLLRATKNFHEQRKLGAGGFGGVYHGFLSDLNRDVAVKRISEDSGQGLKEFVAEVMIITRLRHRNLVQLIGWCQEGRELLLVYDFMPNGSLDSHLFGRKEVLPWPRRYNIAIGVASALLYLHEGWEHCIVHRDVKANNIMLDHEFNAKLGDFGLARTANHGSSLQSTGMAGTMAYMAPECFLTGKSSKESDVYSFGIVALEIACGRRGMDPQEKGKENLIPWVWEEYNKGAIVDAADRRLEMAFDRREMERLMLVGLWCAHSDARSRPSFRQILTALHFELAVPELKMAPINVTQFPYVLLYGAPSSASSTNYSGDNESKASMPTSSVSVKVEPQLMQSGSTNARESIDDDLHQQDLASSERHPILIEHLPLRYNRGSAP